MAIQAALVAEQVHMEGRREQQRILELELQQARYEASLAERCYAACDPDNRLIAAQAWRRTGRRRYAAWGECEARVKAAKAPASMTPIPDFTKSC